MSSPIADMVEKMLAGGVMADMIVLAVKTAEMSADIHRNPVDDAAEKRRAWDRERKRASRHLRLPDGEWIALVAQVLQRDGHKCGYCGAAENLTADHVIPTSRGGSHDLENMVACCIPCNTKKSNKLPSEWLPDRFPPESADRLNSALTTLPSESQNINSEKKEKKVRAISNRGHVCPDDFHPTEAHYEAGQRVGVPRPRVDAICEKMRNWSKVNAHRAVARKSDWGLALHAWIKDEAEKNGHGTGENRTTQAARRPASGDDATLAGMGRIAARVAERVRAAGPANGAVPHGDGPPEIDTAGLLGADTARAPHS